MDPRRLRWVSSLLLALVAASTGGCRDEVVGEARDEHAYGPSMEERRALARGRPPWVRGGEAPAPRAPARPARRATPPETTPPAPGPPARPPWEPQGTVPLPGSDTNMYAQPPGVFPQPAPDVRPTGPRLRLPPRAP